MSSFSVWVLSIAGICVLSVLVELVLPEGQTRKYIKAIFSFFVIVVIVAPLPKIVKNALLRNPRILILDEATASLDTETERQIQDALQKLIKDRTTLAIAHRLSTLRNATRLIVLDDGKIAETGTHEELLRKKGIYYGLVMSQRSMSKMTSDK